MCGMPSAETAAVSHVVECGAKASSLKFAGKAATFVGAISNTYLNSKGNQVEYALVEGK